MKLGTVTILGPPTGKKEEELLGVKSDAAFIMTHWEIPRAVYGGGLQS